MHLPTDTLLQGGKYKIVRFINSGGFGCTYEAEHVMLENRVAIKEFFVKDFCNRDEETAHVTVGTQSKKGLVNKLRQKFIDEARAICKLHHPGIVTVSDVFEENGTAYFVMDYIEGRSLSEIVGQNGPLSEEKALYYIRQVAEALQYVHDHNRLHLDVKPGNIMVDGADRAILIDFGASKQYDEQDGENTSTLLGKTPGYAPLEQIGNDVVKFMPATDIYSLGATLYKLLTGITPLSANLLASGEELPPLPVGVSASTCQAIAAAMKINKSKRPQSVSEFVSLLNGDDDETVVVVDTEPVSVSESVSSSARSPQPSPTASSSPTSSASSRPPFLKKWLLPAAACLLAALAVIFWPEGGGESSAVVESVVDSLTVPEPVRGQQPPASVQSSQPSAAVGTQSPTATVVADAAPAPSLLYVTTSPTGATVYVDGKRIGTTPVDGKEVSRGRHTVKIVKKGYEEITERKEFGEKPVVFNKTLTSSVSELASVQSSSSSSSQSSSVSSSSGKVTINGHTYVDLGLSVKWADRNVGASSPSDYGSYFAWGETSPKSEYTEENSVTYEKSFSDISGNRQYDAARANWGGSWRLPTRSECQELVDKCKWTWTSQGGHNGYKVTGPNGNSIFLPAAGCRYGSSLSNSGENGFYWSSTPTEGSTQLAYDFDFNSSFHRVYWYYRYNGRSVRPVSE